MEARAERPFERRPGRVTERIVNFSPEQVRAPFLLRCGALLIDYIFVVAIPVVGLVLSRLSGYDGVNLLKSEFNNAGWLIAVLLALTNFVLLPIIGGQSIGKMLTGIRIVRIDGGPVSPGGILFRQVGGYLITAATLGIGFLLSVLSSKGRALHDYIAGTVVIYARKRTR